MTTDGHPIRFRVVAGTIEHKGGEVLAVLNEDASPVTLDIFVDMIDKISDYDTDEITTAIEAYKDDEISYFADQAYDRIRSHINHKARGTLVSVPYVLYLLRRILKVQADSKDTPFTFEGSGKHEP